MAKDKLTDYSATNSLNTDVGGIDIDEGMLPSDVNNAIREVMTHLKDFAEGTQSVSAISVTGTVSANAVTGDGSGLTNLPAAGDGGIAMAIALG